MKTETFTYENNARTKIGIYIGIGFLVLQMSISIINLTF